MTTTNTTDWQTVAVGTDVGSWVRPQGWGALGTGARRAAGAILGARGLEAVCTDNGRVTVREYVDVFATF